MRKVAHWTLVILICAFALVCAYVSFILVIGSGFILGDIDYSEAQMEGAEKHVTLLSIFGFVCLLVSILMMFLSGWIARFVLKVVGVGGAA